MPKRPNPFGDVSPLQFKTHVGVKEVAANGRPDLMQDIYDKTFRTLFEAQRNNNDYSAVKQPGLHMPSAIELSNRFEPTQCILDSSGHVITPAPPPSTVNPVLRKQCGEFSSWFNYQSPSSPLSNPTPVNSAPRSPDQMCLNSNGQLTASADMDCGMEVENDEESTEGSGAAGNHCLALPSQPTYKEALGGLFKCGFKSLKMTKAVSSKGTKSISVCETCRRIPGHVRCQFCERPVCQGCVRQCDSCADSFCQLCTTLNYDEAMERAFCINCASN